MQIDTTNNPIIQLVAETIAIINDVGSVDELSVALVVITLVGITLAGDILGWLFIVLKLT